MDILSKCSPEQTSKLVHGVLDGLCKRRQLLVFSDYSQILSLEEWWQVKDEIRKFCLEYFKNNLSKEQVFEPLSSLSSKHQEAVLEALKVRHDDVHNALIKATNSVSQATLKDFDWNVQLALASDKMATIRQPLVTLDMEIDRSESSQVSSVEMNLDELKKLITALDGANRALMQLKTS